MNITIFSGGTGSIALQKGLKNLIPHCHITNLISLYDNGKSTGITRQVCDVLGPSDLRKNQITQYKNLHKFHKKNILAFYEERINIPSDTPVEFCLEKLFEWGLEEFTKYIFTFFKLAKEKNITDFSDFSMANIVYGVMFKEIGYKNTIEFFKNFLEIQDDVVINSFENLFLKAKTQNGIIIHDEGEIVCWNNPSDPILYTFFENEKGEKVYPILNPDIESLLENTDLLICSAGTQWSSLIPTYQTLKLYELIEKCKAKKILIMNNKQDGDMLGVTSEEILNILTRYIPLDQFQIFINRNAEESLQTWSLDTAHTCQIKHWFLGCDEKGRHDPKKLTSVILNTYYSFPVDFDELYFDFDDTIYSRKKEDKQISIENLFLLNELAKRKKCSIISGNNYEEIYNKIFPYFGYKLRDFIPIIWADGGALMKRNKIINTKYVIQKKHIDFICEKLEDVVPTNKIDIRGNQNYITCISVKELEEKERHILKYYIDQFLLELPYKCSCTGKTSLDIMYQDFSKKEIISGYNCMYIGDECYSGNDKEIAQNSKAFLNVSSVYDTNIFLKFLLGAI